MQGQVVKHSMKMTKHRKIGKNQYNNIMLLLLLFVVVIVVIIIVVVVDERKPKWIHGHTL
jgi:uncharacterized membrane protein affecting hemolysin expression